MSRVRIGAWTCRSGNRVNVFVESGGYDLRQVMLEWDALPTLSDSDYADYVTGILPALARHLQECLDCSGRSLVVTL
jgi:hypothetical protein